MVSQSITETVNPNLNIVEHWIGKQFHNVEMAKRAVAYIQGLLTELPANNGRWKAQADTLPLHGLKYLLNKVTWDADAMCDDLQEYVARFLSESDGVLVLSELDFFKQSTRIAGVSRQYSPSRGRVQNCQTGIFLSYATSSKTVILDRALYLPKDWLDDCERTSQAEIPDIVSFATKPELGHKLLNHVLEKEIPFAWVTGSSIYGTDRHLRVWLEKQTIPFVLAITPDQPVWCELGHVAAEKLVEDLSPQAWSSARYSDNDTTYEWALRVLPRWNQPCEMEHKLLLRRNLTTSELTYFLTHIPAGTTLRTLIHVTEMQVRAEQTLSQARESVSMGYYRGLKWSGWYRHITLAMWALIYLTVQQNDLSGQGRFRQ